MAILSADDCARPGPGACPSDRCREPLGPGARSPDPDGAGGSGVSVRHSAGNSGSRPGTWGHLPGRVRSRGPGPSGRRDRLGVTDFASAASETIGIHTDLAGQVHVYPVGAEASGDVAAQAPAARPLLPACDPATEDFWALLGWTWPGTFEWWFNSGSTPSELSVDNTRTALLEGARHIPQAYNDCGLPDHVSTSQLFKGDKAQSVDTDSSGNCLTQNGISVVGFGTLPAGVLARTCPSQLYWGSLSADIRFNKATVEWTTNPGGSCSGKYDVESVATHERGHVFGLAHPTDPAADRQTMWFSYPDCVTWNRTLGRGDVNGLESLY